MINLGSSRIERECKECGNVFNVSLAMLTRKEKFNCPHCNDKISLNLEVSYDVLEIPDELKRKIKFKDFSNRLN